MPSVPLATYRLQLGRDLSFDDAAEIASYLRDLGVSHVYTSPYFQAAPGSEHGYDVVDPSRISDDLGGPEAHARLCRRLDELGLGHVIDLVPNHMAITGAENRAWWDVLENGHRSACSRFFDIDWEQSEDGILLPVLGDRYGRVLEGGQLSISRKGGAFAVHYFEHMFPLSPSSVGAIVAQARDRVSDPATIGDAIDERIAAINKDADALHDILERQHYRLAYWRLAQSELGYRRFFDIGTLIGVRVEDPAVFAATHRLALELYRSGRVDGFRIDHPDGLRDPDGYLHRLRERAPEAWITVEKILSTGEKLPPWPVAGTTGYEVLAAISGLFIRPASEATLTELYNELSGEVDSFAREAHAAKLDVLGELFASDVTRLLDLLIRVLARFPEVRDTSRDEARRALTELLACMPVYRTYVRAGQGGAMITSDEDERWVQIAAASAAGAAPEIESALWSFLTDVLLGRIPDDDARDLALRFQQLCGAAMAKGVEDTACYRDLRLVALDEVGGDPSMFGVSIDRFHQLVADRAEKWPAAMVATSTHDTKRSEDVRARLAVISEIPDEWIDAVKVWVAHAERHTTSGAPDRADQYLYLQTLVGAWPLSVDRALGYMQKAIREAKTHTSWVDPDEAYERAMRHFVQSAHADDWLQGEIEQFVRRIAPAGYRNSLTQTLIKLTAPGVADLYQGCDLWDFSLVDPDNRRPVDFERRRTMLADARGLGPAEAMSRMVHGMPKLWLTARALATRHAYPMYLAPGASYRPLCARGQFSDHVVAFVRGEGAVTIAPRWTLGIESDFGDTAVELSPGTWKSAFDEREIGGGWRSVSELCEAFPVALLVRA